MNNPFFYDRENMQDENSKLYENELNFSKQEKEAQQLFHLFRQVPANLVPGYSEIYGRTFMVPNNSLSIMVNQQSEIEHQKYSQKFDCLQPVNATPLKHLLQNAFKNINEAIPGDGLKVFEFKYRGLYSTEDEILWRREEFESLYDRDREGWNHDDRHYNRFEDSTAEMHLSNNILSLVIPDYRDGYVQNKIRQQHQSLTTYFSENNKIEDLVIPEPKQVLKVIQASDPPAQEEEVKEPRVYSAREMLENIGRLPPQQPQQPVAPVQAAPQQEEQKEPLFNEAQLLNEPDAADAEVRPEEESKEESKVDDRQQEPKEEVKQELEALEESKEEVV